MSEYLNINSLMGQLVAGIFYFDCKIPIAVKPNAHHYFLEEK